MKQPWISLMLCSLIISGCATASRLPKTPDDLVDLNEKHMDLIKVGMSKKEVLGVMEAKAYTLNSDGPVYVYNPVRVDNTIDQKHILYLGATRKIEVIYYLTHYVGVKPHPIDLSLETTPVLFENDQVIGVGHAFLNALMGHNSGGMRMESAPLEEFSLK